MKNGFELIIVLAIISLFTLLAVPSLRKAEAHVRQDSLAEYIENLASKYYKACGCFPQDHIFIDVDQDISTWDTGGMNFPPPKEEVKKIPFKVAIKDGYIIVDPLGSTNRVARSLGQRKRPLFYSLE